MLSSTAVPRLTVSTFQMSEARIARPSSASRLGSGRAAWGLLIAGLFLAGSPTRAPAHVMLDAEGSARLVERVSGLNAVLEASESLEKRSAALYDLGETLVGVTELLNRDLAIHGGQLGLMSQVLLVELESRGIAFAFYDAAKRYRNYLAPFEEYLAIAPEGPRVSGAMFRVLYGRFYDSFIYDPMRPLQLDWRGVLDQIELAQNFVSRYPDHGDREEVQFILAVEYARAARAAPDTDARKVFFERARVALRTFADDFPESLRAAAARVLLENLAPPN